MKTLAPALALVLSIGFTQAPAWAQEADPAATSESSMAVGGEVGLVIPTGDWADISGIGFGLLGRLDFEVSPQLAITANPGIVFHLPKTESVLGTDIDLSTMELLLVGGARFFVTPEIDVHAMTGLNLWTIRASGGGTSDSETETRIPLILGGGYNMASGLVVGANLLIPNLLLTEDGEDVQIGLMFNVGYTVGM